MKTNSKAQGMGPGGYWKLMTPAERSAEMKRRCAVRALNRTKLEPKLSSWQELGEKLKQTAENRQQIEAKAQAELRNELASGLVKSEQRRTVEFISDLEALRLRYIRRIEIIQEMQNWFKPKQ